jgi:hypothetical protein
MFQCARELADAALRFSEHSVPPFAFNASRRVVKNSSLHSEASHKVGEAGL